LLAAALKISALTGQSYVAAMVTAMLCCQSNKRDRFDLQTDKNHGSEEECNHKEKLSCIGIFHQVAGVLFLY